MLPKALLFIALALGVHDFLWIADRPPPLPLVQADYQRCTTIHNGPIHRPDNYSTHPFRRKGGLA